jgi:hypothetical protein
VNLAFHLVLSTWFHVTLLLISLEALVWVVWPETVKPYFGVMVKISPGVPSS